MSKLQSLDYNTTPKDVWRAAYDLDRKERDDFVESIKSSLGYQDIEPKDLTREQGWSLKVEAWKRVGFHNLFTGPGMIDVEDHTLPESERDYQRIYDGPIPLHYQILYKAFERAGLGDKIALTLKETINSDEQVEQYEWSKTYHSYELVILDWNILPLPCRNAHARDHRFPFYVHHPDDRVMFSYYITLYPSGYVSNKYPLYDFLKEDHPVYTSLLQVMTETEGNGIPVWDSFWGPTKTLSHTFVRDGVSETYLSEEPIHEYHNIPSWRCKYLQTENVIGTLSQGIVLTWPATKDRVKITLDKSDDFSPGDWRMDSCGKKALHIVKTDEPLTKFSTKKSTLQVFGKGRSQQQDCVAVLHGKPSIVLFSWHDPSDYTVVIQVSIGDDGYPTHAWIDGSCT
jgi:hypothetical protein